MTSSRWDKDAGEDEADDLSPRVDDIVEIALSEGDPVPAGAIHRDGSARLRLLGETRDGNRRQFLALITDADPGVNPSGRIDKWATLEFEVEERFYGCLAVRLSERCVSRVILRQDGRFCEKCREYVPEARIPKKIPYRCSSCRLNPYR